jgi:hypothetical protein
LNPIRRPTLLRSWFIFSYSLETLLVGRRDSWSAQRALYESIAAIVGSTSGGRKGAAYDETMNVLTRVGPDWAQSRQSKGLASSEAWIHEMRDKKLDRDREIVDEGVKDKRFLVYEEEFSRLLHLCQGPQSISSMLLRESWGKPGECQDRR